MAENTPEPFTPPLFDIATTKLQSINREFNDKKYWMERRFHRYPLVGLVSDWNVNVAKGLTTLAAVCGTVAVSSLYGLFITQPNAEVTNTSTTSQTEESKLVETNHLPQKQFSQFLFEGFSPRRMLGVKEIMENEAKIFLPTPIHEQGRILGVNRWEDLTNSVVKDPILKIPVEQQETWAKLLRTIIFVESGGNPLAKSSTGALGLAQIEKGSADKAAAKLGMGAYNPLDPETNLKLATKILQRNLYLFNGDLELALAAYNLGENTLTGSLKTYYISVMKLPMGTVQEDFENMGRDGNSDPASRTYLQVHPVTYEGLFLDKETSPKITGYLKSVFDVNKWELNFNDRIYLAAKSLFPMEINPVLDQSRTKA